MITTDVAQALQAIVTTEIQKLNEKPIPEKVTREMMISLRDNQVAAWKTMGECIALNTGPADEMIEP